MDQLKDASVSGNVGLLRSLIQDDAFILDRISLITCSNETPLHIAALCGHLEFVRALLKIKPELATIQDTYGRCPLHLACAKGYVEIVKELVTLNSQVCLSRDRDERTPFHLATMNEQVEVVRALVEMAPELTRELMLDNDDPILHLCVKHRCLKALELLVEWQWGTEGDTLVNYQDHDGNTILHHAAMLNDVQTTKYLLSRKGIKMNANVLNDGGFTALDVSDQYNSNDFKSQKIRKLLREAGGVRKAKDNDIVPSSLPPSSSIQTLPMATSVENDKYSNIRRIALKLWDYIKSDSCWLEEARGNLLVAATVTATMAFQAGLNPPGGVWQDFITNDGEDYTPGYSISATRLPDYYDRFVYYNTISLVASLSTILLMISGFPLKKRLFVWMLMTTMCFTIVFILLTYLEALYLVSAENQTLDATMKVSRRSVRVWIGLSGVVILLHTLRISVWSVTKLRNCFFRKKLRYHWRRL